MEQILKILKTQIYEGQVLKSFWRKGYDGTSSEASWDIRKIKGQNGSELNIKVQELCDLYLDKVAQGKLFYIVMLAIPSKWLLGLFYWNLFRRLPFKGSILSSSINWIFENFKSGW